MCTVTYIPAGNSYYITSNRDEKNWRSPAYPPEQYNFSTGKILFPKDRDAGGTWIAAHENGNTIVLLNGAFVAHTPSPPYKKSRGLVLLDLIDHISPYNNFIAINLTNIEPFTLIITDNSELFECRWDGQQKHYTPLNKTLPHIWSSATLYDAAIADKRKIWFDNWLSQHPAPDQDDILHFHQFTGDEDIRNNLMMNREDRVYTVSITSIAADDSTLSMKYADLQNHYQYEKTISCVNNIF